VADPAYEEPIGPELRIPTHDRDVRASAAQLLSYLEAENPASGQS
jgi:adenylylsulfate kinase-like enzyme